MKISQLWLVDIQYNAKENTVTLHFAMHVTRRVAQVAARDYKSPFSLLVRLSRDASLERCVTSTQTIAAKAKSNPRTQASVCDFPIQMFLSNVVNIFRCYNSTAKRSLKMFL